ncbi:MAG: hypothetical protein MJ233_04520 [Mycoplasmoidaceae bacterium]|nr:hypothetical protein [Mycoplasmoidaceae bacterium]
MKLNKILTVLAPITVVGTIVPTVVSCNTDTMTINFGDSINCKDKENKDPAYHSLETVQNTIKKCVNIEESDSINVNNINAQIKLGNTKIIQNVYYDLIASLTILNGFEILLTSYTSNFANSQLTVTFNLNGNQQN